VSNPAKVGRDVGDICGLPPVGVTATDDVDALIALQPDALVRYGPTAAHAEANIALMTRFLRAGIELCSTAMLRGAQGAGVGTARLHQLRRRLRNRDGHRPRARLPAGCCKTVTC
jgi:hypothetical protein